MKRKFSKDSSASQLPKFLREIRFLAIILGLSGVLGLIEVTHPQLPRSAADVQYEWLMDSQRNLAQTLIDVYPNRSQGYLLRAFQAGMCWEDAFEPEVCEIFENRDLRDVRAALEMAISKGGAVDQEPLYHFYALVLKQLNEPPEVVDAAVARWRSDFPHSRKPDPRDL